MYSMRTRNNLSYKDITVTSHAKQRGSERLNIEALDEIRKRACAAKKNGVLINILNAENYATNGLDHDTFEYIRSAYKTSTNTQHGYYYKNFIWVFAGHKSRTLVTIVPCTEEDIRAFVQKRYNR